MLLAIDTSSAWCGIACATADAVLGEAGWEAGRNHTLQLAPQLALLFTHLDARPSDLTAVAVALGPGSWSGLRVGLSFAKGLALARDVPLLGIGTIEALAYQFARPGLAVVPLVRLGRGRLATIGADRQPQVASVEQICRGITGNTLFCGDLDEATIAAIRELLGERASFPTPAQRVRRAAFLAELALGRLARGEDDRAAALQPYYVGEAVKTAVSAES